MLKNVFLDEVFLESAFLLPLPKISCSSLVCEAAPWQEGCPQDRLDAWCQRLDQLARDQTKWPQVKKALREMNLEEIGSVVSFAISQDRESLLHLAVRDDQLDCIALLLREKKILERRNRFGLTPLELARLLHKSKTIALLSASSQCSFWTQPNVEFEAGHGLETLNIEYLPQPVFESFEVLEEVLGYTQKAKDDDVIPSDRIWMGVYYDKEIQQRIHPRLAVRWVSERMGFGLFAAERILPCLYVGEYTGLVQERRSRQVLESNYCVRYTAWQMGRKKYVIDAQTMGNFTRFINHSEQPNLSLVCAYWRGLPRFIFISLEEISEGTQLTFDYGKLFWKQ